MRDWKHYKMTEKELKKVVRDTYDMKIFTSLQCDKNLLSVIFMPILFIGAPPIEPSLVDDNQVNRRNKLKYIEDSLRYDKETSDREKYLNNIGMVYEYMNIAGTRGINGYPSFMSCNIMTISDTKKFIDMYDKYVAMREEFEKQF